MTNITISNNTIDGRESVPVRIRMFDINIHTGEKHPNDVKFNVLPGEEHRVNIMSAGTGFEVRPLVTGTSYAMDDTVAPDVNGIIDAYNALKTAIRSIPLIRNDLTLSPAERDTGAAQAWAEVIKLAQQ